MNKIVANACLSCRPNVTNVDFGSWFLVIIFTHTNRTRQLPVFLSTQNIIRFELQKLKKRGFVTNRLSTEIVVSDLEFDE